MKSPLFLIINITQMSLQNNPQISTEEQPLFPSTQQDLSQALDEAGLSAILESTKQGFDNPFSNFGGEGSSFALEAMPSGGGNPPNIAIVGDSFCVNPVIKNSGDGTSTFGTGPSV